MEPIPTSSSGNGSEIEAAMQLLSSVLISRRDFALEHGISFKGARNIYDSLGYKRDLEFDDYWSRFVRGGIANRIVRAIPDAVWGSGVSVIEDPDPKVETSFEKQIEELFIKLDVVPKMRRTDILASISEYSVLLIGAGDTGDVDLAMPMDPLTRGVDSVHFLTPISQDMADIRDFVEDKTDPRFGLPKTYNITFGGSLNLRTRTRSRRVRLRDSTPKIVHWTRVLHFTRNLLDSEVYGSSVLRAPWNLLDDLVKLHGGGSEAAWKAMNKGTHFDQDPNVRIGEQQLKELRKQLDEYQHGYRRHLETRGMTVTPLGTDTHTFSSNVDAVLRLISGVIRVPVRKLVGSERGELASTEDRNDFNDATTDARTEYATPMLRDLIDRFITIGAVDTPKEYVTVFPEIDELTVSEQATVIFDLARANKAMVEAGQDVITTNDEIRDDVLSKKPLSEVTVSASIRGAADLADEEAPELEWQALHRVADANVENMASEIEEIWTSNADSIGSTLLQTETDIDLVRSLLDSIEDDLGDLFPIVLGDVLAQGGDAGAQVATGRESFFVHAIDELQSNVSIGGYEFVGPIYKNGVHWKRAQFELEFDATNPRAIEWAANRSSALITEISPDTRDAVQLLITDGLENGVPPTRLATRVKAAVGLRTDQVKAALSLADRLSSAEPGDVVKAGNVSITVPRAGVSESFLDRHVARYIAKLRRDRAILISRRETLFAANQGQRELWLQNRDAGRLPSNVERVWIVTPDDRLRDEHAALEGARTTLNESWERPGGGTIEPGEDPNCRCGQGLVVV